MRYTQGKNAPLKTFECAARGCIDSFRFSGVLCVGPARTGSVVFITMKHIRHRILSVGVLFFLCLFVAAEPFRIANAALDKAEMPCCAGKAGHCDSGIAAKKVPPPKSEPMCGLHGAEMENDGITIVAEPAAES